MQYQASKLNAAQSITDETATLPGHIPAGWVRIRLAVAGICGTDMHYFKNFENAGFKLQRPLTLGHEACGYVQDPNESDLVKGQLVALNPIINCGTCNYCMKGESNLCTNKRFPGSATTVPHIDGFFQHYFDFPAFCCKPVKSHVDVGHLAFAEPLSCSLHAVKKAGIKAGDSVLILGCGPMGLLAAIAAMSKNAKVTCVDVRSEAVDLAVRIGVDTGKTIGTFNNAEFNDSFDTVIEASGAVAAFNQALEWARKGGTVSILSTIQPGSTGINIHRVMLKELNVIGSFQFNSEFDEAIEIISSGVYDFDSLIADRFSISQIADAFILALSGKIVGKVQLVAPLDAQ